MDQDKLKAFLDEYNALTQKHGFALKPQFSIVEIKAQGEAQESEPAQESPNEEKPQDEANNVSQ